MTWVELEELYENGHEIGSHTHTHPHLTELSEVSLDSELRRSKELLHEFRCETLAYPFGEYDARVISRARRYYVGARGYYDPSTKAKDYGYNVGVHDEAYKLKVFPTEHAPMSDVPLLELPAPEFQKTLQRIIQNGIAKEASMIFVLHQGEDFSFGTLIDYLIGQPDVLIRSLIQKTYLVRNSIRKDHLRKFRLMCKYLSLQEKIRVLTINELVRTYTRRHDI